MAVTATYPTLVQDWLKHELDPRLFRKAVTISFGAAGDLITGTVLGKITSSGKYVPVAPSAEDGSEAAAAILLGRVTASGAGDQPGVIVTGNAEIAALNLSWPAGITTNQKNAALAQLAALGFQTRKLA